MRKAFRRDRRSFLKASVFGIFGAVTADPGKRARTPGAAGGRREKTGMPEPRIREYRTLGRTGFRVSDLGTGSIQEEGLLAAMLDAGVNYIDTAESYPGHHRKVGNVIKGRERRRLFITSKMLLSEGDVSREGLIKRVHKALQELGTDYIDCMMMHCPEKVETLKHPAFHSVMQQMKTEGKVRFVGVSHHGSFWFRDPEQSMDRVLLAAAEDGRFDVFLFAYNFLQMDRSGKVLEACREKKIGAALMKTTPVAKYYLLKSRVEKLEEKGEKIHPFYRDGLLRFREKADRAERFIREHRLEKPEEIRAAAIKFVLSNSDVSTVCCSLSTFDELDRILLLSGTRLEETDTALLRAYKTGCGRFYCRHGCGACEPYCPQGVPVNTIMRYTHYFVAQGREKEAMLEYAKIPGPRAEACSRCPGHCESVCPYGVPIQGMLLAAHEQLTLA